MENSSLVELPEKKFQGHHHMIAGAFSGIAGVIAGHPLDTLKTKLQAPNTPFITFEHTLKYTFQAEGLRGFYRGIVPPLSTVALSNSITFAVYGKVKTLLPSHLNEAIRGGISGSIAGVFACLIVTPRDLIKSNLQVTPCPYMTGTNTSSFPSIHIISKIFKEDGLFGMYRGSVVSIVRDIPGNAVYFSVYESLKKFFTPKGEKLPPIYYLILSGGSAGIAYWSAIYPIDTIRTRIQIQRPVNGRYQGIIECTKKLYYEKGIRGFYRGYFLCILRSFPISAVNFSIYEMTLHFLRNCK